MIQVKRGNESNRLSQVLSDGQPLFTLDKHKLYFGSASLNGGVEITASLADTASLAVSSSYAQSSSNAIDSNNSISSSYSQTSISASYSKSSSLSLNVDYSNISNKPTLVSSSQQIANFNGFPITASIISASNNILASTFQGNGFNITNVDWNKLVNTPMQLAYNIPTASLTDLIYYSNTSVNADGIVGGSVVQAGFKLVSIIASSSANTIINLGTQSLSNAIVNTEIVRPTVDEIPLGKQFFSNTDSASLYVSSPNWGGNSVNLICKYEKVAGNQQSAAALTINVHGYITSASVITASNNDVILVQTTNGPVSVYLPASFNNSQITVKKITGDTATVTVFPSGSQQIDSDGPLIISHYNDAVTMIGNGNSWWII